MPFLANSFLYDGTRARNHTAGVEKIRNQLRFPYGFRLFHVIMNGRAGRT
jgi:hypothetical protein